MTDQQPPELFAIRPVRSDFARQGPSYALRRFMTVVVLLLIVGGALYWKFSGPSHHAPGEIPTVKSEGNYKQRPDDPGGIDIPHQDVQVYQELDNTTPAQPQVEHLLPPPEAPQAANVMPAPKAAPTSTVTPDADNIENVPAETAAAPTEVALVAAAKPSVPDITGTPPAPKQIMTTATQTKKVVAAQTTTVTNSKPVPTAAPIAKQQTLDQVIKSVTEQSAATSTTTATSAAATPAASTPSKGTVIQLAASADQSAAQTNMQNLQTKYGSILGPVKLHLVRADLGAKGVFYRIQSSPLADDKAKSLCASLKSANTGCMIVRN